MNLLNNAEIYLVAACAELLGKHAEPSEAERSIIKQAQNVHIPQKVVEVMRDAILQGNDPLGDLFAVVRSAIQRRDIGAVYTPQPIVDSMIRWLAHHSKPARIVDPGAGSGRFIFAAGTVFPSAELVAVELDPVAALMLRAAVNVRGWAKRTSIIVADYRDITLPPCSGITAFVGNPPYVRHHGIEKCWKVWYAANFSAFGIKASTLAGLHLHFFLQTRLLAKEEDIGAFITSAEWLDVNYGSALRELLLNELGGLALHVLEPTVEAFPGTATTAAITCFRVGKTSDPIRVRSVKKLTALNCLSKGKNVSRDRLSTEPKWSFFVRPSTGPVAGEIEIGELFRVHRGQVTGANDIWIAGNEARSLLPQSVHIPAVTKALDLIAAGAQLGSSDTLRRVIDLPPDLASFSTEERRNIEKFLDWAKACGGQDSYTAQRRKAWWSVGLKEPAPILCTYMARRSPQFTLNACDARHINVAHGLYPFEKVEPHTLVLLVSWLNKNIDTRGGRTYSGGLTKFEPREVERLRIPRLDRLPA